MQSRFKQFAHIFSKNARKLLHRRKSKSAPCADTRAQRNAMITSACKTTRGHMISSGIPKSLSPFYPCLVTCCM